jgi:signal transduction histidine kinase
MALHDHAGQLLTALRIDLELIKDELSKSPLREKVELSEKKVIELFDFIRNISQDLRPSSLNKFGLIASIRKLIEDMKINSGINIKFFSKGITERLQPEMELALYRIIQESLNNVIKHADADEVFINLTLRDETVKLTVEDNGIGFDYQEIKSDLDSKKGPLGLNIMKERAIQIGGELWIETEKGKGTMLVVHIPLRGESISIAKESEMTGLRQLA